MLKYVFTVLIAALVALHTPQTNASEFDFLFNHPTYTNAKISPDGKHLAIGAIRDNKQVLMVLSMSTFKPVGSLAFPGKDEVGDFYWVNDERIVIAIVQREPWLNEPRYTGELYAIDYDGDDAELIFGYRNYEMQTGSRIKKKQADYSWAHIIDLLPNDNKHIVISSTPMSHNADSLPSLLKLNVYSGKYVKHGQRSPVRYATFATDLEGEVVLARGTNSQNQYEVFIKEDSDWHPLSMDKFGSTFTPLTIADDNEHLYILDNFNQDKTGLFKLNLKTKAYTPVYTDKKVDIADYEKTKDTNEIYALRVDEDFPAYILLNKDSDEAKIFKDLTQSFAGHKINITSRTDDGSQFIVNVSSDIEAGAFYVYKREKNELMYLFSYYPELDKNKLSYTDPIQFTNTDGIEINGYFTQGKGAKENQIAPLVVLVHGGPHARDQWGYSSETQFLAQNGYSVLQVNFRGSTGYGQQFESAGYHNWGKGIQQDIHEALQWAIAQGKADKNKVCIMGASFGGYSALQNPINYPHDYQCAVANAGIYDLEMLYNEGDIENYTWGDAYLKMTVGTNKAKLQAQSPVHHIAKFNIPLFLAHGEQDKRAPIEHAEALIDQLEKHNKKFEWYEVDDAAHGFYDPVTQKDYMNKVVRFLDKHLK